MNVTIRQLAELVHGRIVGDPERVITGARTVAEAQSGHITFVENDKYTQRMGKCLASAAVVRSEAVLDGITVIQVDDPIHAFVEIVRHFQGRKEQPPTGIDPRACVPSSVRIGEQPSIYPFASIGEGTVIGARCRIHSGVVIGSNCQLGDDVTIYPNTVLYEGTCVGHRTIIHANAVIGADGFGYRFHDGKHVKVPQLGHVEIGEDVEIGACTTIDRGTFQTTFIGDGTKIDNLVQIAHNCRIGRHNLLVSQMGIAGSSSTGEYVIIAGQVGVRDGVHIDDGAVIGAKAGIIRDVAKGERMLGSPATPEREQKRIIVSLDKLPEMCHDMRKIKQHLGLKDAG